ncbi:hypothetical protein [Streptomyces sp. NRRL S-1448]|uniref:hypothetical protein n=1 Tax=Streptomyces sp. NRRL S-1448 TaxID=1463883 RepID=UPI0004BE924C|nr:hypothetical protein [Streptomyces sp. NRRL S-1448]
MADIANDTELLVPIRVHALLANREVWFADEFSRWSPSFRTMLDDAYHASAEPPPSSAEGVNYEFEGVHVEWELPEALTAGRIDPDTGESKFPLVPNRWLVVRYAHVGTRRTVAGWVVDSDYLQYRHGGPHEAKTPYLDPFGAEPKLDFIGRVHPLAGGRWDEPRGRTPHLTAIGPGLPAFAAFAPYHQNVFAFHDDLLDLRGPQDNYPPNCTLSYAVIGWYSTDTADILRNAAGFPDLLPPDTDPNNHAAVAAALGWAVPDGMATTGLRTRYAGTALGLKWEREGAAPPSDRPAPETVKVAIGHSSAEAAAALIADSTRSHRNGQLIEALFTGDPDLIDDPDGAKKLQELMRTSWFGHCEPGYRWRVVNRPSDTPDSQPPPPPQQPAWVTQLNEDQAAYDAALPALAAKQWRLWRLGWLSRLDAFWHHPKNPDYAYDTAKWNSEIADLKTAVAADQNTVQTLLAKIPHGPDLDTAITHYAAARDLPAHLELKRSPEQSFHHPADPALVLSGLGNNDPLTRDTPLPCRRLGALLDEVQISGTWHRPSTPPPQPPNMEGLPPVCAKLIAELELLDKAARTTGALSAIVANPPANTKGVLAEHTRVWKQPWLPMYLSWKVMYCATPFQVGSTEHWEFNGDRWKWKGTGAQSGNGAGGRKWTLFEGRSFLTPSVPYVLGKQAERLAATAPSDLAAALRVLAGTLATQDLLSQSLDGFHDWLLQQDPRAQVTTDSEYLPLVDETNHTPDGSGDRSQRRFQPVRAGQFYFRQLLIIDRFGRVLRKVTDNDSQPAQLDIVRAASVEPDKDLYPNIPGPQRMIQLPPRLLHDARLRFEPKDDGIMGWLLINKFDDSLMVYQADGSPLGELRVVLGADSRRTIGWNPLPHAPYQKPDNMPDSDLKRFLVELLKRTAADFDALVLTIDRTLARIGDPSPVEDRSQARLIGRPIALVRAGITIDLLGPDLTDPSWDTMPTPAADPYTQFRWTVRLGDLEHFTDGLIGYIRADTPGGTLKFNKLHVLKSAVASPYLHEADSTSWLRLKPRTETHQVTMLVCPHTAVHATTDILPVGQLTLDTDVTHAAMSRIRASFRLNPLLAVERSDADSDDDGASIVMPRPAAWHGAWSWAEPANATAWTELPILATDELSHPDDPVPTARAGYLQLHPGEPS